MTTQATHTPGPWTPEYDDYGDEIWYGGKGAGMWAIRGPDGLYLAGCALQGEEAKRRAAADARLIASAPDLLAALKGLLQQGRHEGECDFMDGGACRLHLQSAAHREEAALAAIIKAER